MEIKENTSSQTKIEHHAILHSAEYLEKRGYEVTYLDVDEYGVVKLDDLKAAIRPDTILISVMLQITRLVRFSQSKRLVRLLMSMVYYSTQMQYRHLDRFQSMLTNVILIC